MSVSNRVRTWWKKFRFDPYWRAGVEVSLTAIFTFVPLVVISTPIIQGGQETSFEAIFSNLSKYLESGELILPILGLCGTFYALVILNKEVINSFMMFVFIILPAILTLGGAYILGSNLGFSNALQGPIFYLIGIAYLVALFSWFVLASLVNRSVERPEPEDRANALLTQLKKRKGNGDRQ